MILLAELMVIFFGNDFKRAEPPPTQGRAPTDLLVVVVMDLLVVVRGFVQSPRCVCLHLYHVWLAPLGVRILCQALA